MFENIIEQVHDKTSMDYDVKLYDKKTVPLTIKPEDLIEVSKKTNEMSFFELKKYVKKVEEEGYDATTYTVDLNGKIAFPFICIIMVLTGAATGMRSFVKENIPGSHCHGGCDRIHVLDHVWILPVTGIWHHSATLYQCLGSQLVFFCVLEFYI